MRAFVKDGKLHVVTHEYIKRVCGKDLPEKETVFDETWTAHIRLAFFRELNEAMAVKPHNGALEKDADIYKKNLEEE